MSALSFNDLLAMAGVAPQDVNVILHSPAPRDFALALPALCISRPEVLMAYQATHSGGAERALLSSRPLLASFVRIEPGSANGQSRLMFAGIFEKRGSRMRRHAEITAEPEVRFLLETFRNGADYGWFLENPDHEYRWFDTQPVDILSELRGRLLIGARLTRTYVRLAENLNAPVLAILERVSPDMTVEDVTAFEHTWMDRLHTRVYGLNA